MDRPNGRALIVKLELVTGIALATLAALVACAPLLNSYLQSQGEVALTGLGLAMAAIGVAWMVRIARSDPDLGAQGWRDRDH